MKNPRQFSVYNILNETLTLNKFTRLFDVIFSVFLLSLFSSTMEHFRVVPVVGILIILILLSVPTLYLTTKVRIFFIQSIARHKGINQTRTDSLVILEILQHAGFYIDRASSRHVILKNPITRLRVTVPHCYQTKDLKHKTLVLIKQKSDLCEDLKDKHCI